MSRDLDFIVGDNAKQQLVSVVERIERLEEEKAGLGEDIKEVYGEAKSIGFDTKILRQVIRLRKVDKAARDEADSLRDTYMHALETAAGDEE